MSESQNAPWLALSYKLGALPSRNRVYVWRRLKEIGAVNYQQSVAILPQSDHVMEFLEKLRSDILQFGGEASIISLNFLNPDDEMAVVTQFNENIRSDYNDIERLLLKLIDEIETVHKAGKITQAKLHEELSILSRNRKAYEKVMLRDHFKTRYNERIEHIIETTVNKINLILLELRRGNAVL